MRVTELGMVTDDNPEQPKKAYFSMLVTELGIIRSFISSPFK